MDNKTMPDQAKSEKSTPRAHFDSCRLIRLVAFLVISACGEPVFADEKVAMLDWSGSEEAYILEIDGKKPDSGEPWVKRAPAPSQARLIPGKHNIRYGGCFGASVILSGSGSRCYDEAAEFDLKAGRLYRLKS